MKFHHIRHATSLFDYAGIKFLIDPVLCKKEVYPAIPLTPNKRKNPLVDLSTPLEVLNNFDVMILTHTHLDHFDDEAKKHLTKEKTVLCQSKDVDTILNAGFSQCEGVVDSVKYKNIEIIRTKATHGKGQIGEKMGTTSGYILKSLGEPTLYFVGDSIYTTEVEREIKLHQPDVIIINGGSAKFLGSSPIVMDIEDIEKTMKVKVDSTFVVVHLETFNHCFETSEDIAEYFSSERLRGLGVKRFIVPQDNEIIEI